MPRMPASASNLSSNQLAPLNMPVNRAMSSVYPMASSSGWSQPITPVSAGPSNLYQNAIPNLGDASRPPSHLSSRHTSPTGYNSMTPVMPGTSLSYFLTHRTSPYRAGTTCQHIAISTSIGRSSASNTPCLIRADALSAPQQSRCRPQTWPCAVHAIGLATKQREHATVTKVPLPNLSPVSFLITVHKQISHHRHDQHHSLSHKY